MRRLTLGVLFLSLCACGRLAQYGDPRLRPQAETAVASTPEEREVTGKGTVRRVDEDGGFWGVRADDGRGYRLADLPPVYQKDGTRIRFHGRLLGPLDPAAWRTVIELIDVSGV